MRSKFCLSSTTSFEKINKAATNRSITKQTFTFSRSSRFDPPKANCPLNTYGGDFLGKQPSGTSIGYGKKSDFTRCLTVSPSSSKYKLKSFWDENLSRKKGSSFGLSRDKVSFNQYIPKEQQAVPSSVQYSKEKPNKINSPKYSLRPKTTIIDKTKTIEPQNMNPGPGSYLNPELNPEGSSKHTSKFQNITYGQSKSVRFGPSETLTPGPGKYREINNLSNTGNYLLSQNKGGTQAKFDKNLRESTFDKVFKRQLSNPGPGYYQLPSEFGQYDGDIYNDLRNTKRSKNGWNIQTERTGRR